MGENSSTPTTAVSLFPDDGHIWPENIYQEARDMSAVAFLTYTFGYLLDVSRKEKGFFGLSEAGPEESIHGKARKSKKDSPLELIRSFAPGEVKKLVKDNEAILAKHYPENFSGEALQSLYQQLGMLEERADGENIKRPLTLEEYDDRHQEHEMVYAVCKDSLNKRVTLVFRGTDNKLARETNWSTNISVAKTATMVPDAIKDKVGDEMWLHSGFYNYVFNLTFDDTDHPEKRKHDEIVEDVKHLLKQYPDYKLYVTGHSLGGALSSLVAFYLCCNPEIPKPVTCLNFAAPRVGDKYFRRAVQALEQDGKMRFLRVVNENDTIAVVPTVGYKHVGFQVKLYESDQKQPKVTFPKMGGSLYDRFRRTWRNSILKSLNLGYDHSARSYRERMEKDKAELEKINLNHLYADANFTGLKRTLEC